MEEKELEKDIDEASENQDASLDNEIPTSNPEEPPFEDTDKSIDEADKSNKKDKKEWSKKKTILFWSIGGVASLAIGITAGVVLGSVFNAGQVGDYSNIDASQYAVDYDALVSKYNSLPSSGDYSQSMTPCELANTALSLFYRHDKWQSQGYGASSFNVLGIKGDQEIRSTFIKDNNSYFEESLSMSSIVKSAWRMYEDYDGKNDATVNRYKGTVNEDVYDSSYDLGSKTEYAREDYKSYAGRYLDGIPCIYIISDKCLSSEDQSVISGIPTSANKTSEGYEIELELNPRITVKNYVLQMQTTADLAGPPSFKFVHLSFKTDLKLNLISMTNYEVYYAKSGSGAGSNMTGRVTTYFKTGDDISIPALDTQTTYDLTKDK